MRPSPEPLAPPPFQYPREPHARRHGPRGYLRDEHYKPWLRDEFSFRCVYCCCREVWFPDGECNFSVEHILPGSIVPGQTSYDSLLYACSQCNSIRGAAPLPLDPCGGLGNHLEIRSDGTVHATTPDGLALIRVCHLNRPELRHYRRLLFDTLAYLQADPGQGGTDLRGRYTRYPDDLPDLSTLRPPGGNARPGGVEQSAFARRRRGELPVTY